MDDGLRRTANLLKLVRLAAEFEAHEGRDLRGFLDQASDRAALSDREAEAAVAAEDHAGVRIMTVHAAKGLEFDCVAVADLGRKLAGGGQPPSLRLAFDGTSEAPRIGLRLARAGAGSIDVGGYGDLNDAAADADAEESGRLAYVAASRARTRLLLSGTIDPEKDLDPSEQPLRRHSVLSRLLPALGASGGEEVLLAAPPDALPGLEAGPFDAAPVAVRVTAPGRDVAERLSYDHRGQAASAPSPPAGRRCWRSPSAGRPRPGTSPTPRSPTMAAAATGSWPSESSTSRPIRGRPAADARRRRTGGGMRFGRAVHELLERAARDGWRARSARGRRGDCAARASTRPRRNVPPAWSRPGSVRRFSPSFARAAPGSGPRCRSGSARRGDGDPRHHRPARHRPGRRPLFVDYKTDSVTEAGRSGPPRGLRAAATALRLGDLEATGSPEVASAYCFLQTTERPVRASPEARRSRPASQGRGAHRPDPRGRLRVRPPIPALALSRLPREGPALPVP